MSKLDIAIAGEINPDSPKNLTRVVELKPALST